MTFSESASPHTTFYCCQPGFRHARSHSKRMGLGPQCWTCRSRRVRCTSEQPSCQKCYTKGIECDGYSDVKPITFRNKTVALKPFNAKLKNEKVALGKGVSEDGEKTKAMSPVVVSGGLPRSIDVPPALRVIVQAFKYRKSLAVIFLKALTREIRQRVHRPKTHPHRFLLKPLPRNRRSRLARR